MSLQHHATITLYSHYFTIRNLTPRVAACVYALSREYTQFAMIYDKKSRKKRWTPTKTFGIYVDHGREFRFHIGQYPELLELFKRNYVEPTSYEILQAPLYEPDKIEVALQEKFKARDDQAEAIEFAMGDGNSPLLLVPTGEGKTFMSLATAAARGYRFCVRVQAMYIPMWTAAIQDVLNITRDEICEIQGSDILQRVTNYPGSGLEMPKAFVISNATMNAWQKLYEEDMNNPLLDAYTCRPMDFAEHLGIGTEIYDEAHQHPHAVYRSLTYANTPKIIFLTATLLTKDPVLRRVQAMQFPRVGRFEKIKPKQYITAHAYAYQILDFRRSGVETMERGQNSYSHPAFEKSIIRNKHLLSQYLTMIRELVERTYFEDRVEGDSAIVFVATKAMADIVMNDFRKKWPNLDIRKYLQENDYEDIMLPDIVVTTVISGGTGIDKKNLRHTYMTISMDSPNGNVQVLGRLRQLKHRTEHNDVHFHYLYCSSIPKQVEYHKNKIPLIESRVKEIKHSLLDDIIPKQNHLDQFRTRY